MEISHTTNEINVICKDFQRKREKSLKLSSKLPIPRKAIYEKRTFFLPTKHTCQMKAEDFSLVRENKNCTRTTPLPHHWICGSEGPFHLPPCASFQSAAAGLCWSGFIVLLLSLFLWMSSALKQTKPTEIPRKLHLMLSLALGGDCIRLLRWQLQPLELKNHFLD